MLINVADKALACRKAAVGAGQDIRAVGSDIKAGQAVLQAGALLGAAEIGILATVGAATVRVGTTLETAACDTAAITVICASATCEHPVEVCDQHNQLNSSLSLKPQKTWGLLGAAEISILATVGAATVKLYDELLNSIPTGVGSCIPLSRSMTVCQLKELKNCTSCPC